MRSNLSASSRQLLSNLLEFWTIPTFARMVNLVSGFFFVHNQDENVLPSDLVEEILLRVPARSLTRLRYTCKQWETLTADPRFINKHLTRMRGREEQFIVLNDFCTLPPSIGSTISCVGTDLNKPCSDEKILKPDTWVYSVSHCDGLLLLVMKSKLAVTNPLFKEARFIKCGYGFDHSEDVYGLGYQSSNCNDYKMVRFRCKSIIRYYEDKAKIEDILRVEVYEFKSDSWKLVVVDKTFDGFYQLPISSVCLRGTPYWIGYNRSDNRTVSIQSFNFTQERFEPLCFSSIASVAREDSLSLGIFRGESLSLLHGSHSQGRIHIWVMKKHWTRLMTTLDTPQLEMFPRYSSYFLENKGKLTLSINHLDFRTGYIVGENQECQKVEDFSSAGRPIGGCYYIPSLLQVPGFSR